MIISQSLILTDSWFEISHRKSLQQQIGEGLERKRDRRQPLSMTDGKTSYFIPVITNYYVNQRKMRCKVFPWILMNHIAVRILSRTGVYLDNNTWVSNLFSKPLQRDDLVSLNATPLRLFCRVDGEKKACPGVLDATFINNRFNAQTPWLVNRLIKSRYRTSDSE